MNATGMNTAMIENVVDATAMPISEVPSRAAVRRSAPFSMWRTMFSRTTMASSISTPIASDRPSSVMKFRVKPHSQTAMNAASTDVGSDSAVISVERQEFRNAYTTKIVSTAPSTSDSITLFRLPWASSPPSYEMSSLVPAGRSLRICSISARTFLAMATVDASRERMIWIATLGLPLRIDALSMSAKPSLMSATWFRRTMVSPLRLTTTCEKSSGRSIRPTRRMPFSSSSLRTLPTGAFVFWRDSAFATSLTETLYSRSFSEWSSTDSSRRREPFTCTLATPSTARKRSASWSSARREISAWLCELDDRARFMIGWADGSTLRSTGSRISVGSL